MTTWNQLAPPARWLFYAQAVARIPLLWLPLTVGAFVGLPFVVSWTTTFGLVALAWVAILVATVWLPWLAFDRWAYAVREYDLLIARGVLVREVTAIPLSRVQHVDTRQGPLESLFGLARVQIHTASGVGGDGVIPGLLQADAEALRDLLLRVRGDGGV